MSRCVDVLPCVQRAQTMPLAALPISLAQTQVPHTPLVSAFARWFRALTLSLLAGRCWSWFCFCSRSAAPWRRSLAIRTGANWHSNCLCLLIRLFHSSSLSMQGFDVAVAASALGLGGTPSSAAKIKKVWLPILPVKSADRVWCRTHRTRKRAVAATMTRTTR